MRDNGGRKKFVSKKEKETGKGMTREAGTECRAGDMAHWLIARNFDFRSGAQADKVFHLDSPEARAHWQG
jgi:hypothetical protein